MGILRLRWQTGISAKLNLALNWATYGALVFGLFVGIWALFRMWQRLGQKTPSHAAQISLSQRTLIALPILFALVAIGLRPLPFSNMVGPSVFRFLNDVENGTQKSLFGMQAEPLEQEAPTDESVSSIENTNLLWHKIESDRLLTMSRIQVSTECPYLSTALF